MSSPSVSKKIKERKMVNLTVNGLDVRADEGDTLLGVIKTYGFHVPTLCHHEGLTPYGACRLCLVELGNGKLVTSCTYPVQEGLNVLTGSERVLKARAMVIELLLATCPRSKVIQDLASKYNVRKVRFRVENEDCILCGLCVRMCEEQMMAKAIGFSQRGERRKVTTPFDLKSEECRLCGGCIYICPACQIRCTADVEDPLCNACANLDPPCVEKFENMMCYMDPCVACELAGVKEDKR